MVFLLWQVCFTCKTTRFTLFGEWGTKCKFCKRTVCSKCMRKVSAPNVVFAIYFHFCCFCFFFCRHFPHSMISTGITHVPCICRLFHPAKSAPWYIGIMLNMPDENVIHLSKNRFTQQQNVLRCLLFLLCICLANYLSSSTIILFVKSLVFRMNATVLVQTHNRADR